MSQSTPAILALTGYAGAGKDTFAKLLQTAFNQAGTSATIVASGDLIRSYVTEHKLGDPGDRALLQKVASDIMAAEGYEVWLKQSIAKATAAGTQILLYPGLRHPDEVDYVHDHDGLLLGIKVPVILRYQRSQARNRPGDEMSLDEFKQNEINESRGQGQQLEAVMQQLDVKVSNNGNLEDLEALAERIVKEYPNLHDTYKAKEE